MGEVIDTSAIRKTAFEFVNTAIEFVSNEERLTVAVNRIAIFVFVPLSGAGFAFGYVTFRPVTTLYSGCFLVTSFALWYFADKNKSLSKNLVNATEQLQTVTAEQRAEIDRHKKENDRLQGYVDSVEDLSTLVRTQRRREESLNPIVEQIAEGATPKERKAHLDTYLRTAAGGFSTPKRTTRRSSGSTPSSCAADVDSPLKKGAGKAGPVQ